MRVQGRSTLNLRVKRGDAVEISIPGPGLPNYKWTRLGHEKPEKAKKLSGRNLQIHRMGPSVPYTESVSEEGLSWNEKVELKKVDRIKVIPRRYGVHLLELVYVDPQKGPASTLGSFTMEIDASK